MNVQKIIEIFNRDIEMVHLMEAPALKHMVMLDSIRFYIREMELPDGDQAKIHSTEEYRLLIELYRNEMKYMNI